jgi:predicted O-methyltransferase YrrM
MPKRVWTRDSLGGWHLSLIPTRLRSLLTLANAQSTIAASNERMTAIDQRLTKIEADIAALASLVRARDDRAQKKLKAGFSSLLNMVAILPQLELAGVLPPFPHQGFEITGEEAAFLFQLIRRRRPKLILELGGGSSTVLFAAALRANGSGRLVSIEHDEAHAKLTAQLLEQAELSDRVEQVVAPLAPCTAGGRTTSWYDLEAFLRRLDDKVDLLFVDGPPGKMQSLSRYPALPMLAAHLAPHALVFVDDGGRDDEIAMIERWRELEGVGFRSEALDFLPHAPVLLTMESAESRIAELRAAREGQAGSAEDSFPSFGERRSGVS